MGGEYRMNVPTDLSQKEMCEWVCFDAMDAMNNWSANKSLQPKFIVGATDTYMKYPEDDVYTTACSTCRSTTTCPSSAP